MAMRPLLEQLEPRLLLNAVPVFIVKVEAPSPVDISADVPAYLWTEGCGPTAAAMVLGYHDAEHIDLIQGDSSTQTAEVQGAIAELAVAMQTDARGWTRWAKIDNGTEAYALSRGVVVDARMLGWGAITIDNLKVELANGRPAVLLVDSDGNGSSDHFVTVVAVDTHYEKYGCFDTYTRTMKWKPWRQLGNGAYSVYGAMTVEVIG